MQQCSSVPRKVAVFGSAFNPPHCGHEDVLLQVAQWADAVVVVPNFSHAFGKQMAEYALRLRLVQALVEGLAPERLAGCSVQVSDIEQRMASKQCEPAPIYTYDVLVELQKLYPNSELTFVVGPDNADPAVWNRFYRAQEILQQFSIWPAEERLSVRSTAIRAGLARGRLPSEKECPQAVIQLLQQTKEYQVGF